MQSLINQIDALLPQTQCGQCGYNGCLPYAEAIAKNGETINRCPPGGVKTLIALGELLRQDTTSFLAEMQLKEKPAQLAAIREAECIGCTKCIQACPVDAIIGSTKQLHTVIENECTGCGLCVLPCPVDCIDLMAIEKPLYEPRHAKERFNARKHRFECQKGPHSNNNINTNASPLLKAFEKTSPATTTLEQKRTYISRALTRVKARKATPTTTSSPSSKT